MNTKSYAAGVNTVKFFLTIKQRVAQRPSLKVFKDFVQGAKDAYKSKA